MKNILILIVCLIFLISCSSRKRVVGTYVFNYHNGFDIVKLNKDNSFQYSINSTHIGVDTFYGIWRKTFNRIELTVLKPEIKKYYNPKDSVVEFYDKSSDSIVIEVLYENLQPDFIPVVAINGNKSDFMKCNLNGIVKFPLNYKLREFFIGYIGEPGIDYVIKNRKSNYFKVFLFTTGWFPPYTHTAIHYKWIFRNSTLYPINDNNNKIIKENQYRKNQ